MRSNLNLNLSQKAFLLIAVPLVAELVVLGFLAHALASAEQEIRKERHARSVVMESNILLNNFLDCSLYLYEVGRLRKPGAIEQFDRMFEQIPTRIRSLKNCSQRQSQSSPGPGAYRACFRRGSWSSRTS